MRSIPFRVVNVFAEDRFGGNPLAVIEDARGLSDDELMAICRQFNLSETTFVFPPVQGGAARVRIFSPDGEMAFAGHPTLGTSWVVRAQRPQLGDAFSLELDVGLIPVTAQGDRWELRSNPATSRAPSTDAELAELLGLEVRDVAPGARWMSSGTEQLLVPLASVEALRRAWPTAKALQAHGTNRAGRPNVSCFVVDGDRVTSRYFWVNSGEIREDPGTGSACANLGSWLLERGAKGPSAWKVEQGHATGRVNHLSLRLDEAGRVYVGGRVIPLMRGAIELP